MTMNRKMRDPGEMATETMKPMMGSKAAKRMARICATPDEIAKYRYSPNEARDNLRPGIPLEPEAYED